MEERKLEIEIPDWGNVEYLKMLMNKYGSTKFPFSGKNENGEDIQISIFEDRIILVTYQENGWVRENWYWEDGTVEELFKGRWE